MRADSDVAADFLEMELHRVGVGKRQGQRRALAFCRADCAKEIGALVALVGGLRPRSSPRPLSHKAVLLADARFVLT